MNYLTAAWEEQRCLLSSNHKKKGARYEKTKFH